MNAPKRSSIAAPKPRRLVHALLAVGGALALPVAVIWAVQSFPQVGPLPGRIVYTRAASESRDFTIDIYTADANGENERRLTNTIDAVVYGSAAGEDQPRWSPDGAEIAFSTFNGDGLASIWRMPAAGGTPTPMAVNDGDSGGGASWQPDGQCVVYAGAHRGGQSTLDLRRACRDGTVSTVLSTDDVDERCPDVSPDGALIVYQARRPPRSYTDRTQWALWVMRPDGSGPAQLYAPPVGSATHPRWSPDMRHIAFVVGLPEGVGDLTILDLATGVATPLVRKVAGPLAWSPDGRAILFHNVDAAGPRTVSTYTQSDGQPQYKGLYVFDRFANQLLRLLGPAGGEGMSTYQWGYAPDWFAPSPTPTATATDTATATGTTTPTATATNTPIPNLTIYLPLVGNGFDIGDT